MNDDIAIKISNVSKSFVLPHEKKTSVKSLFTDLFAPKGKATKQQALKNIDFEIKKGEFFGIVGRNGSGKSTLLKIIAGIYQPTKGSVKVNGKLVPFIELGVGFNPELTGRENVYLNGSILGFSNKKIAKNYKQIVEFAELEDFMDQKLKNYSSGMQVRLAFACATMAEADILLIDEVLAVGDADFQRKCFNYFKTLKKDNVTVVFVTHDMSAVREYCDRTVLINDSLLEAEGEPAVIAKDYLRLFGGSETIETDGKRWGRGDIKYAKKPRITFCDGNVRVDVDALAKINLTDVIFGFSIEDGAGRNVLGTNSLIAGEKSYTVDKNQKFKLYWQFYDIFSSGSYDITITIASSDGATIYDWWSSAVGFEIRNENSTPYIISPKITVNRIIQDKVHLAKGGR